MWDRDLYLYFGIVSVPVPFPLKFCLIKPLGALSHLLASDQLAFDWKAILLPSANEVAER